MKNNFYKNNFKSIPLLVFLISLFSIRGHFLNAEYIYEELEIDTSTKKDENSSAFPTNPFQIVEMIRRSNSLNDAFELDKASRPFNDFIDDLSTWYLRRSRDRLKEGSDSEKKEALHTLSFVLRETAKLLAPFMPFLAEDIWQKMKNEGEPESVHLLTWPEEKGTIDETLLSDMKLTRSIVTDALELRSKENIKVRQPLQSLTIPNTELKGKEGLLVLIQEELNVKEVIIGDELTLDTTITPELQKEGAVRDIIRGIHLDSC